MMPHRRSAVKHLPHAVPDELIHHPELGVVRDLMNRRPDLPHRRPGLTNRDRRVQRSLRRLHQPPHLLRHVPHHDRPRRVAVIPVQVHRDVNIYDISVQDHRVVRDSVTDALVQARAHALRKPAVVQRARIRPRRDRHRVHRLVDVVRRRRPGRDHLFRHVQHLRRESSRASHPLDVRRRRLHLHDAVVVLGQVSVPRVRRLRLDRRRHRLLRRVRPRSKRRAPVVPRRLVARAVPRDVEQVAEQALLLRARLRRARAEARAPETVERRARTTRDGAREREGVGATRGDAHDE
mmetsp:Transcript_5093/g.19703  ORF Transcript_5093/g.19703 Transcript_5093/m.19703 type:complete len:293 (+) Transcript_5093:306-1184(+)